MEAPRALDELGIGRGSLVALYAPNSPDALAVRYARKLRTSVAAEHGAAVAEALVVMAVDEVPLTEQGKPDRAAILRLGARAAA